MAEKEEKKSRVPKKYEPIVLFLRDAGIAVLFVALVLLAMYAYTGMWPPLVVVESDSMMHGTDNLSHIGTIDTGDLVLVKKVNSVDDVETYVDGLSTGHRTYGDYGDVVVYKRDGSDSSTPIIHRAMIYLEFNPASSSYRAPSLQNLPSSTWTTSNPTDTWNMLTSTLYIKGVGWGNMTISIDVRSYITTERSGYVTKGDHNFGVDQQFTTRGPVDVSWIVGKARGEIPWFGLLKLWSTGTLGSPAPENSVRDLWIALALIVITPILIDLAITYREKRLIAAKKAEESESEQKKEEAEDSGKVTEPPKRS